MTPCNYIRNAGFSAFPPLGKISFHLILEEVNETKNVRANLAICDPVTADQGCGFSTCGPCPVRGWLPPWAHKDS